MQQPNSASGKCASGSGCHGCKFTSQRLTFLGWKSFCKRFHCLRDLRCIDYRGKANA